MIEVLKPGTKVLADGVNGIVQSVALGHNGRITYEIEWWAGRERRSHWFVASGVEVDLVANERETVKVGFVGGPKTKPEVIETKGMVKVSSIVADIDATNRVCHVRMWAGSMLVLDREQVTLGRLSALLQYGEATINGNMYMLEKEEAR